MASDPVEAGIWRDLFWLSSATLGRTARCGALSKADRFVGYSTASEMLSTGPIFIDSGDLLND